jgi:hypothetical protein
MALVLAHAQKDDPRRTYGSDVRQSSQGMDSGRVIDRGTDPRASEPLLGYALNVDALLRDRADQMRTFSEQIEAGELSKAPAEGESGFSPGDQLERNFHLWL